MKKIQLAIYTVLVFTLLFAGARQAAAVAVIEPGIPITNDADVPVYLTDGSYLFGITVPTLGPDDFLLPIEISGAANLQNWVFTLTFDNSVVNVLDPLDGTSGIYGAEFTPGDPTTLSFILGGFPFNALGAVESVAGSYPSLLTGPSGDGVLAFILFQYLPEQEGKNPDFGIRDADIVQSVPEPGTLALLMSGLALLGFRRRMTRRD